MANKKDVYYFSHDANALSDPKILAMRCDYGFESYGLYWAIIEMLRNESNFKLPLHKNTYRAIKMQTGTTIDVEKYLNDCINEYRDDESGNGLFNSDGRMFWSASLLRRLKKYEEIKEKRSQAANARWNKTKEKNNSDNKKAKKCKSIKGICKSNASAYKSNAKIKKLYAKKCKLNQIKSNQTKLNKIKINEMKSIYPSDHEHKENENLDETMNEMEMIEFRLILHNCELHVLQPELTIEITEILKEMFMNPLTRKRTMNLTSNNILYALKNFAIANTKTRIKKPKEYFKKCILSSLEQTALSAQYDVDTIYETEE